MPPAGGSKGLGWLSEQVAARQSTLDGVDVRGPLYGFGKWRCPALSNENQQLLLHAGPYADTVGVTALQGLGYFPGDRAWAARVALHRRQLQRQLKAATDYPSRLPANIFFQLHYECRTFSASIASLGCIGPVRRP